MNLKLDWRGGEIKQKFPGSSMVKNPPANAGDIGLIPGLGRSPGEGSGNPLQYSCLGSPMVRGTGQGWRRVEYD